MTAQQKITREVLENYLHCKTKGFLTLAGEFGTKSDYEAWRLETVTRKKDSVAANFVAHYRGRKLQKDVFLSVPDMAKCADVILRAQFENDQFSISFDGLVKNERSTTQSGNPTYIPVLFEEGKVRALQKVMVGLLALIVSEVQETQPTFGLVFHEEGRPTTVRFVNSLQASKTILTEVQDLHRGRNTPMLVLNDHCQVCEFRARCHAQAVKEDNLSLLRGMNERQITHLRGQGIFTVNQLSYTFRARRRPKRAKKAAPIHHLPLRALALREKKIFVHGDPQVSLAETRIYLDIEGTPENQTYYLIGIYVVSSESETQETYWADADTEQDEARIFVSLLDSLSRYSDYSLLHFGNYEVVALRRMRTRMGEPYASQIDDVLKHSFNVLSLITAHVYFPTYSNSLKDIGSFLGHLWSDPSSTGVQTLVWRSRWLGKRDTSSRAKLIQYNKEDCTALRGVVDFLENVLLASHSVPVGDPEGSEVVRTSELSAKRGGWSLFGETQYVLDEFRAINKLSYFDYQRDKVSARAGIRRKKSRVRKLRRVLRPNETVTYRASKCPSCDCRDITKISQSESDVTDLRFTRGGVKRWITRHVRQRYSCERCGTRFMPAAIRGQRQLPRYGRGLIGWCVYQLVIGGQNLNRIHRSLSDLFGLSIPRAVVYFFKEAVAEYFREGYERIPNDLLAGKLLHVDETTINLQKDKGYVWVLASTESVYFFYRRSREGSFLADMLHGFKGVLVSDFFTAYDSLDLPQQRCLVHLMRDFNDDLLKHPFDDQLKSIATKFSFLLKGIVDAIDRYGLKKRHLNKYIMPATKFCDWVMNQEFTSEAARNYARRITKYRDHLFMFLRHDGVPWNNNNVEHAIKSFAKFRRTSNGVVTEDTISEYLVILSVCSTCEYRGIDFLKVLLGRTKGDFGFGPRRYTPLRLRSRRDKLASRTGGDVAANKPERNPQAEAALADDVDDTPKVINLNKLLPKIFEGFRGSFYRFRYRAVLAPDLWPVQLSQKDLDFVMLTIVYVLRRETRQRPLILRARNFRFDKSDPVLGLTGRHVAVSLSVGSCIRPLHRLARQDAAPNGIEKSVNLGYACKLARRLGGAAEVKGLQTGRITSKTVVTTYIPQYVKIPDQANAFLRTGHSV